MMKFNTLFAKVINENTESETDLADMHIQSDQAKSYAVDVYLRRGFKQNKQSVFSQIKNTLMSAEKSEQVTAETAQSTIPPNWQAASEVVPYKDTLQNGSSMLELTIRFPAPLKGTRGDVHDQSIIKEVIQALGFKSVFVFAIR